MLRFLSRGHWKGHCREKRLSREGGKFWPCGVRTPGEPSLTTSPSLRPHAIAQTWFGSDLPVALLTWKLQPCVSLLVWRPLVRTASPVGCPTCTQLPRAQRVTHRPVVPSAYPPPLFGPLPLPEQPSISESFLWPPVSHLHTWGWPTYCLPRDCTPTPTWLTQRLSLYAGPKVHLLQQSLKPFQIFFLSSVPSLTPRISKRVSLYLLSVTLIIVNNSLYEISLCNLLYGFCLWIGPRLLQSPS